MLPLVLYYREYYKDYERTFEGDEGGSVVEPSTAFAVVGVQVGQITYVASSGGREGVALYPNLVKSILLWECPDVGAGKLTYDVGGVVVTAGKTASGVGDVTVLMDVEAVSRVPNKTVDVAVDANTTRFRFQEDATSDRSARGRSEDARSTSEGGSYKDTLIRAIP